VEFNGSLREQQKPIVKKVYKEMKKQGHCILHAVTGMGKTSMSLYLTSKLKQKTLILVHQDFLLNQWVERIEQFLPNAKIGILKQSRIEVEDKDIVIGMIQSICSRKYDIFKQFGFVVCDEYHHFGAEYFSQVLYSCGARYMLGLTATPQRKDGLTKVLKWHLGEILSFTKTDILYNVSIECLRFRPKHDEFKIKKSYYGGVNVANLINQVCTHKGRNEMIRKELIKYGRIGRQILVLSDRVQHLKDLKDSIPEDISTGLYIGGMTQEERKISETKTIIFGTFVLIKEAVDIPSLNTLVLATSKSDIIQAVGRILRKKHPKFDPLIIDIIDELSLFERQAEKRRKYYEKQGYTILDPMKPVIVEDVENSNICLFDD
jgi:superfamily II DNA or RNA helicase